MTNNCKCLLLLVVLTLLAAAVGTGEARADEPKTTMLDEVVVTKKSNKYSKKNNPAVDLLQEIRKAYPNNDPTREPRYSYDRYEKIIIALNDFDKEKAAWLSKQLDPIDDYIDTAHITGKPVLNLSVREKASSRIYTSDPDRNKEIVKGFRSAGIDESFNQENIQIMLEDVFREIDIFGNDITLMQNRFVSPLSNIGADYYKYFLGDTTLVNGTRCVELIFVPRNAESFSFNGSIYVATDSTRFIKRVTMRIPKALNLNFVKNIFVEQDFVDDDLGNRHKVSDDMSVELQLMPGMQGFYTSRSSRYGNFSYHETPDFANYIDAEGSVVYTPGYDRMPDRFWDNVRLTRFKKQESSVARLGERIDAVPILSWIKRGIRLLVTGYIPTGHPSKFDIGPVNTMLSASSIEGLRMRLGGMTTADFSPHWFGRGYVAYGTKDHHWKYQAEAEYSFTPKKKHSREFPMHSIRLEHMYDLDMIGQHYLFTNSDNIFLSLKRKENLLGTYRRLTRLTWTYEKVSGLSLQAGVKMERQEATKYLPFIDGAGTVFGHYDLAALFIDVQYAPGAKFVQTASYRLPVNMDNWVFRFTHEWGPRKMLGADFTLNKTEVSMQKRFWFSAFGYLDVIAKGGHIWSRVPYPALTWPNANLSYTIQPESFALMNPMEFASDSFATWDMTYWLNGMLFNRIPVFNELKLREVLSFRGFFGRLSSKNNPAKDEALYRFPADSDAAAMTGAPYMELGVGIDNIFSIMRLDYVWRLNYRGRPGCSNQGLRVALHFTF